MPACPFCEGEVSATSQKCRHCGEWLNQVEEQPTLKLTCPKCRAEVWDPKRRSDGRFQCHFCSRRFTQEEGSATTPDRRVSPGVTRSRPRGGTWPQDPPPPVPQKSGGGFTLPVGLIALVLVVVGFACARVTGDDGAPSVESARAASDSSAPRATATRTPEPTTQPRDVIPGLTAFDITGNVEPRGLSCEGPTSEPAGVSWFCSDGTYMVTVSGPNPTRIRTVSASAIGVGDASAAAFLGYIASVPYDGSQPDAARSWLETSLGAGGSRTFGDARFTLGGPELGRWLDVTALDR